MIDELCGRMLYSKAAVRGLKMKRNIIMKRVWSELERIGYWVRRGVLRDMAIPIDWRTGEWCVDGE